jgi:Rad52/22 family double-strand break repair protein
MGFSSKQLRALRREVDERKIRTRQVGGRDLSYIEGWHAIAEANRIFGFDGWTRETIETRCVIGREMRGNFLAVYTAKVRITVFADGRTVVREGHGTGESHGSSPAETHDVALKAAETDATKRALATFGKPFGLSLYLTDRKRATAGNERRLLSSPRNKSPAMAMSPPGPAEPLSENASIGKHAAPSAEPNGQLPDCGPELMRALQANPGVLSLALPRRVRDRDHLRFITNQPCLCCGRRPSDAHHLRFAQPRALGMKASDEYTVPLCRLHHREVHRTGNELAWWKNLNINPLEVAQKLWQQSHEKCGEPLAEPSMTSA